mmetsp:Transcript_67623/g.170658  ORF Transcript_67623/g.170658 Transcript_67623/m.170658 type:complete len:206 (+) Transcript_67623:376-993(+)
MPLDVTNSRRSANTLFFAKVLKVCMGLLRHMNSGLLMKARAKLSNWRCVYDNFKSHVKTDSESRSDRISLDRPRRLQISEILVMSLSGSLASKPIVKFSFKVPSKNIGSEGMKSERKCDGTKTALSIVVLVGTVTKPANLNSKDFPSPCGPRIYTSWSCEISRKCMPPVRRSPRPIRIGTRSIGQAVPSLLFAASNLNVLVVRIR